MEIQNGSLPWSLTLYQRVMPNLNTARFGGEDDLPNLEQHNNHMAHVLTLDLYNNLRGKESD